MIFVANFCGRKRGYEVAIDGKERILTPTGEKKVGSIRGSGLRRKFVYVVVGAC